MQERPEPERFEIELSSNADERHGWRHHGGDPVDGPEWAAANVTSAEGDVVVSDPVAEDPGPPAGDQRRLFVVATIVGALALVLGWLIGRSGGSGEVATLDATVPAATQPEESEQLTADTLPSAATTTTRPPRTTTTSTLVPAIRQQVEVDPRLVDVELTLVGAERSNVLVELDVAAQTLVRRELGGIVIEPGAMLVGDDWVVIANPGGGQSWLVGDDGSRQRVDLGEPWELMWQAGTDRFWRADNGYGWGGPTIGEPTVYEEFDVTGDPTGKTLELPSGTWSWQADPGGGLIVERTGKLFSIDESSIDLIGTGELIALSSDIAVMRNCDDQLRCALFVTDRLTGEVSPVPVDEAVGDPLPLEGIYGWGAPTAHSMAPDGSMCAVILPTEEGPVLALLDLRSGAVVELGDTGYVPTVVWSPDARLVFFIGGFDWDDAGGSGGVSAYDRRTGEVFPVVPDGLNWQAVAARPT